jgi:hypothetical protein
LNVPSNPETVGLSPLDAAFEKRWSRFVVGIDLGTTNCAVSFMDSHREKPSIEIFQIEQLVDLQTTQRSDTLPSFHYELTKSEGSIANAKFFFADGQHRSVVGIYARQRGLQMPGRSIASAKSWLCHTLVDRTSDLLPWSGDEGVAQISCVRASQRYLEHIKRMWDRDHPSEPLSQQDVIVTLPASFDEVARQLTIQAAVEAGLPNVLLIEEPQAAFYAWLHRNQNTWMQTMKPGESILVCDIGGGTTDFTLIRVVEGLAADHALGEFDLKKTVSKDSVDMSRLVSESLQATYGLHRVAVGEHLMLGGDNLDLALAKALEQRLLGEQQDALSARQWDSLKAHCRVAKETLLGSSPPSVYMLSLPGSGSKLIENTKSLSVEREWARELLLDGFFGTVPLDAKPSEPTEGFQEFGLPYASEPNVLKHLARFLWEHRWAGRPNQDRSDLLAARPDWILFNGGVLESSQVRDAILNQIQTWFSEKGKTSENERPWKLGVLEGNRLDLAVAQGASYFGLVRRGVGVRIDSRLARAYYLLVEQSPPQVMCVMPANAIPLDRARLDEHPFELSVGMPVQFPLFQSTTHLVHTIGQIVPLDLTIMTPMAPIRTVLEMDNKKHQRTIPVVLESELSEIGTLAMNLVQVVEAGSRPMSWKLEFDVRAIQVSTLQPDSQPAPVVEIDQSTTLETSLEAMETAFGSNASIEPQNGMIYLSEQIGKNRRDWNPTLLREMWRFLMEHPEYRERSPEHESRWINLVGWCLRPGFGMAADDWRVNGTWRAVHNKMVHRSAASASETIVLWRRIAGGFTVGQQRALFQDCWPRIRNAIAAGSSSQQISMNVLTELLRLVGSLEWLSGDEKGSIAELALTGLSKRKLETLHGPLLWMLGRLGSRRPVYASLQQVVDASRVQAWIEKLLKLEPLFHERNKGLISLCLMQMTLRTRDRYRDHPSSLRERVANHLKSIGAPELHIRLVEEGGRLDVADTESVVGDALPLGFRLGKQT